MRTAPAFGLLLLLCVAIGATLPLLGPRHLVYPDAMEYADTARGVARGQGALDRAIWVAQLSLSERIPPPAIRRAIFFPLFESLVFRLFSPSDRAALGASLVFFLLSAPLVFILAIALVESPREGAAIGLAAGALALLDANGLQYGYSGLSEPMFACAVLAVALAIAARPFAGQWLLVGALVGLSQGVRLNGFTLILPCLLAARTLDRAAFKRRAAMLAIGAAPALIAFALRNKAAVGDFSFVGVNGAIVANEIGGLSAHGVERVLFDVGAGRPSLFSVALTHPLALAAKAWRGLNANISAAFAAASPLALGAAALFAAARRRDMSPRLRAVVAFTFSSLAIWIALYSIGEFEGPRFYVPLSPLILLVAVIGYSQLRGSSEPSRFGRGLGFCLLAVLLFPGIHRLVELVRTETLGSFRRDLARAVEREIPADAVVLSDIPWAVAWYGDRTSVWIPSATARIDAVAGRAGATHLVLSPAISSNFELDEDWRRVYYSRAAPSPAWRPLPDGAFEAGIAAFARTSR
jgi:hypothetical protein